MVKSSTSHFSRSALGVKKKASDLLWVASDRRGVVGTVGGRGWVFRWCCCGLPLLLVVAGDGLPLLWVWCYNDGFGGLVWCLNGVSEAMVVVVVVVVFGVSG
ncbi:hypothetical protein SO802_033997 [Lithocarpus litseifolius]|uniref:Transmembrane protein n=1 Tax=Lithocarpus litseifolius TaxID=425828 RepID=A0AAW2BHC4_9ROSI